MDERGLSRREVESLLREQKRKDLSYKRVLSSMCTYPHEVAAYAHKMFLESNLGDSGLFPGTKEMEKEVVRMIGSLLGRGQGRGQDSGKGQDSGNAFGYLSTGGTESNIQVIHAVRNRKRREGQRLKGMNIIVPETAHFSFDKIADLLCVEVRKAGLDEELRVAVSSVAELIDDETICVVGIAGTTEFGQVDPIKDLAKLVQEQKQEKGREIFLFVDAAFGGFVLPFLEGERRKYEFDFSVEGVGAVSVDPHKMGLSTIPAGCLLFREESYLEELAVPTPYLTTKSQSSLTGTRSGASAAATFAVLKYLGREGLRRVVRECVRLTRLLVRGAAELGVSTVVEPVINVAALRFPTPAEVERVASALVERGWRVSVTRAPKALRLVVMPHVKEETVKEFLEDLEAVVVSSYI